MRKLVVALLFVALTGEAAFGQAELDKFYARLSGLEQQKLGRTYASDPMADRIERLEKKVFGHTQSGAPLRRLDALSLQADLGGNTQPNQAPANPVTSSVLSVISPTAAAEVIPRTLTGHTGMVTSVAFSPDGRKLASGSSDTTIKVWDVPSGRVLYTLKYPASVDQVAFTADGRRLSGCDSGFLMSDWDVATGKLLRKGNSQWQGENFRYLSLAFSPDGRQMATGMNKNVAVWDQASLLDTVEGAGNLLRTLKGHSGFINAVAYSPDGHILASGSMDGTVKVWDAASGGLMRSLGNQLDSDEVLRTYHGGPSPGRTVWTVSFSPDGRTVASAGDQNGTGGGGIEIWDAASGSLLRTISGDTGRAVAFSPDGRTLASGGSDGNIKIWNADTGNLLRTLTGHTSWVRCVAFSPDGSTLASGSADNSIKLWGLK